ncbi:hypothetical protein Bca52824_079592 [Brassica carinata]|uniref:B3 domain-containing protein n=1 Tax=Brassica carinata TaxID=52824 RepID=A0A8X7Q1H6_BRACI|nr:hypothetical protein Bca52824_079592 [Brassica carinata]
MADDQEAAQILIMISQSQPPSTNTKNAKLKTVGASSSWTTDPTPEWLLKLMTKKNGAELKKIIKKELSATDVRLSHDRKKRKTGVDAKLVVKLGDSDVLKEFDVNLRRWKMKKKRGNHTFVYNLIRWKQVVEGEGSCGLKKRNKIRLWSFHSDGKLYFALATLPSPPPPPSSDSIDAKPEEIGSASVIYNKSNDDWPPK